MKALVFAVSILVTTQLGCNKSEGDKVEPVKSAPGVSDCPGAMAASMKLSETETTGMPESMKNTMKSTMDLMAKLCVDDKWSSETTDCLKAATASASARACMAKLTPEQMKSMIAAMSSIVRAPKAP
jgi:hypothetical protein